MKAGAGFEFLVKAGEGFGFFGESWRRVRVSGESWRRVRIFGAQGSDFRPGQAKGSNLGGSWRRVRSLAERRVPKFDVKKIDFKGLQKKRSPVIKLFRESSFFFQLVGGGRLGGRLAQGSDINRGLAQGSNF